MAFQGVLQKLRLLIQLLQRVGEQVHNHLDGKQGDVVLFRFPALLIQVVNLGTQAGDVPVAALLQFRLQLGLELSNLRGQFIHGGALVSRIDVNGEIKVSLVVIDTVGPAHADLFWKAGNNEVPDEFRTNLQMVGRRPVHMRRGNQILLVRDAIAETILREGYILPKNGSVLKSRDIHIGSFLLLKHDPVLLPLYLP